ncbi:LOW QUALITY PROTEIN: juvenile hormone acid O-methyltransferase-like [Nylanderia fulva]|uniref:LOW QUALITY PROTEIN: juvenile hormone acid O-methyltransferase-like n=1 Tax=Nylanderia fulva TaxID=613905 RepID=UPI0010FB4610|nr:LOW QUALITY PROTEIN: juvenile hormone acid O-methyltransferase-like [Nylanderia fulva]
MMQAARYALFTKANKESVSLIVNEFAKELKYITGKCMDVGCGPGDITKDILLTALNPKATMIGTDINASTTEYANKMYGDKERLKFEVLDIQTKNLPEKYISKFDHIFSFYTLHWCHDLRQTFENMYCMLRPGKTMLILNIVRQNFFEVLKIMAQDERYASYMEDEAKYVGSLHYSTQPREEIIEMLEDIGFQVNHCSHRILNYKDNAETFLSMVTSQYTFKFLDDMPNNLRDEFKNELARKFAEIRAKEYADIIQDNLKIHNVEKEKNGDDMSVRYTALIIYAQKVS